jgi:hypothetical protein
VKVFFSSGRVMRIDFFRRVISGMFAMAPLFLVWAVCVSAAPTAVGAETLLPPSGFSKGWAMEGKAEVFTPETLYKHINGEAELYLPYGFEKLEFALYTKGRDGQQALAVDIYKMRSLLDAFGIYSNYRDPDSEPVKIGAEGFATDAQLMFYQDRYFVQLSASGSGAPDREAFIACAGAIAKKLPAPLVRPGELALLRQPNVVKGTEKYVAVSLLGYKFFNRGMVAQATLDGKTVKAFIVLNDSTGAAQDVFDQYAAYLKQGGGAPQISKTKDISTITGRDPLYKGVAMRQRGSYLFGVSNVEDPGRGISFLDQWAMP